MRVKPTKMVDSFYKVSPAHHMYESVNKNNKNTITEPWRIPNGWHSNAGIVELLKTYTVTVYKNLNNSAGDKLSYLKNTYVDIVYPTKKRLLWVNKQIVLPTGTPITIITNSYDVIHSWFLPGLGLKMDCVPGRSTHHTIFIEKPGYYYGQCAEVCGRRHHHMPIKILAVPFTHFLY